MNNELWAQSILRKTDPSFVPRWVAYKNLLLGMLHPNCRWIDVGCGDNSFVRELKTRCAFAVGTDIAVPADAHDFVAADLRKLPFPDNSVDVVSMRFVVEHIEKKEDLNEVLRVLKPGGRLVFITTNLWSPLVFVPRLLPYRLKHYLITKIFNVQDDDVFPTHHRLNTPAQVGSAIPGFSVESVEYISDLNTTRKTVFLLYWCWHMLTSPQPLHKFRANILAVFRKR